jgi:hypothetical protein
LSILGICKLIKAPYLSNVRVLVILAAVTILRG